MPCAAPLADAPPVRPEKPHHGYSRRAADGRRRRARQTRQRILEVAQEAILAKGFDATSIEEIVAGAEITRSGFFYHFPDKNELARALLERYIERDRALLDDVFRRGHELSDDPLHAFLIGLKLFAEVMADMPNGHPGCIVATVCYQERLFDRRGARAEPPGGAGLARPLPRRARAGRRALPARASRSTSWRSPT